MTPSLGVEVHLNAKEGEHGGHHNDPGHGRVVPNEDVGKAGVGERGESFGEELLRG